MERQYSNFFLLAVLLPVHFLMDDGLTAAAKIRSIDADRSSLLALKSHISSDPHNMLIRNWTTQTSVCNWIGVACGSLHTRVIELNISGMGLVGSLPPEIGNLSSLVTLDMNDNSFHGVIPPSIFNISSLQVLTLSGNDLSSELPIDMCRYGLHNLKILRISFNNLYGEIPSSLGQCSKLELLSFYNNSLDGDVPREIGNLTLLTSLYLGVNNLQGNIPREICYLNKLNTLWMESNKFIGSLPRQIRNLTTLRHLRLHDNILTGSEVYFWLTPNLLIAQTSRGNLILEDNSKLHQLSLRIGMGKESGGGGGGQSRIIFFLIVYVHLVTSQRSDDKAKAEEAPPCPPSPPQLQYSSLNSCPNHLITELLDALTCTPPPPHDEDGDLQPVSGMMSDQTSVTLSDAVVLALLKSRNADKGTPWEIVLFLMFVSAVLALQFCENLLRNMYPRFVEVLEKLVPVLFVNGVMAFLLPAECFWVPLLCLSSSLLSLIIAPFLP